MSCGEVSDAQDVRVTLKSDVFAFAVTMWEMATRMHPWHGLGILAVRFTAHPGRPRCPSDTNAGVSGETSHDYAQAVASALCGPKLRENRYLLTCTATYTHAYARLHTHTHRSHLRSHSRLQVACAGCDEGCHAEGEASCSACRTGARVHGCQSPGFPLFRFFVQG